MKQKPNTRSAPKRPKGDRSIHIRLDVDDIIHLLLTGVQLSRGDALSPKAIRKTALAINRLVNRSKPFYRTRRQTEPDIAVPLLFKDGELHRLPEVLSTLRQLSAAWRKSQPEVFDSPASKKPVKKTPPQE